MTNDYNYGPLEHELTGGTFAEDDDEHERYAPEGERKRLPYLTFPATAINTEEWTYRTMPSNSTRRLLIDKEREWPLAEVYNEETVVRICRDHRLAALVPGLVEALRLATAIGLYGDPKNAEARDAAHKALEVFENAVAKEREQ